MGAIQTEILTEILKARFGIDAIFDGYEQCPDGLGVAREYKGISPLDRSKYILLMRGAITPSTI